jgi:hypothetical protein
MTNTRFIPKDFEIIHEDVQCVVYGSADGLHAIAYHGRAAKHDWYNRFTSRAARDRKVSDYAEGWKVRAEYKAKRKAALNGSPSPHAAAAAAIRRELKASFPDTSFSVRSSVFSGGDSVDIAWTDGPSLKAVNALVGKYQEGHFDGMQDLYEYSNSRSDLPQVKYVMPQREISYELASKVADELNEKYGTSLEVTNQGRYWDATPGWDPYFLMTGAERIRRAINEREEAECLTA